METALLFICVSETGKEKLLLHVDVVGQACDVQRGQLCLNERTRVIEEVLRHLGMVLVHPAQRHFLLQVCHLADGV